MGDILIVFSIIVFTKCAACNVSENEKYIIKENEKPILKKYAQEKFGKNFKILSNTLNSFSICINSIENDPLNQNPLTHFFIFDNNKKEIIFEDSGVNINVFWKDQFLVGVTRIPGMEKKEANNNLLYSYNVLKKEKQ